MTETPDPMSRPSKLLSLMGRDASEGRARMATRCDVRRSLYPMRSAPTATPTIVQGPAPWLRQAAVGVEPLARTLGVTKGSFYAHYRDRDELITAALAEWARSHGYEGLAEL